MAQRTIVLTHDEYHVLKTLVERFRYSGKLDQGQLTRFIEELGSARVVDATQLPRDIVTVNSVVRYRYLGEADSGETSEIQLVFPADVKQGPGRVSILSPLGLALMGEREGAEIEYLAPGGSFQIRIESVEQSRHTARDLVRG
ncbi:MAG: hypothetical protein EA428_14300 [Spirochaetaceae bacterium]|nr:MAG: hypothetical protein EA428_14300 [Spirochaetaceae bacterium]